MGLNKLHSGYGRGATNFLVWIGAESLMKCWGCEEWKWQLFAIKSSGKWNGCGQRPIFTLFFTRTIL